jgi:ABC-type uncharacterized transport system YnjBCD permease subunit
MRNKTEFGKNGTLITALIILVGALYIQVSWIIVWYVRSLDTPEKKTDFYLSLFPSFLQNSKTLCFLAFALSFIAFLLSALSLRRVRTHIKWLAYAIIAISVIVGFLSLFQLM